jgi:hypothetical protein
VAGTSCYNDNGYVRYEQDRLRVLHYTHLLRDCGDRCPLIAAEAQLRLSAAEFTLAKSKAVRTLLVDALLASRERAAGKGNARKSDTNMPRKPPASSSPGPTFQFK